MENKPNIWIIILTSLLIIVMMIPITALVITPSKEPQPLDTPIYDLGNMSLNEVFNIDNDTIFTELNNHSLREVFEGGNLVVNGDFNSIKGFSNQTITTPTISNGIVSFTATAVGGNIYKTFYSLILNDKYYTVSKLKSNIATSNDVQLQFYLTSSSPYTNVTSKYITISNDWQILSSIGTIPLNGNYSYRVIDRRASGWTQIDVDYMYLYNLTSLGIDTLTVSQMDNLYDLYDGGIYSIEVYETLYNLELTTNQWQYYYDLYIYYNSL